MKTTIQKTTKESFEVETPAYYKHYSLIIKLTERFVERVYADKDMAVHSIFKFNRYDKREMSDWKPSTEEKFYEEKVKALKILARGVK